MKRYIISFLVFILSAQCLSLAGVVPVEQARQTAAAFFSAAETKTRASSPSEFKLKCAFPDQKTRSGNEAPAMYIFERTTGGYAIVSADDVARPVLAYSLDAWFPAMEEIPDNMLGMLQWYSDVIGFARSKKWAPFPETRADAGLDPSKTVQLITAQWNQRAPFNNLVKEINGEKPPIGCVATSIAIVMRYHKWPERGTGVLPAYDYLKNGENFHVDGITLGHTYNWELMPEGSVSYYTPGETAQIERLLYDVAVMSHVCFYPGGSSASSNSALKLTEYFNYDKSMTVLPREIYSSTAWENLIKKDIDSGLPVLYCGSGEPGAHAFVIDGYNGRYFSINYGWGGSTKSRPGHTNTAAWRDFYTLNPIDGHEEDLLVFNEYQEAIFHIMPEKGNEPGIDALYSLSTLSLPYSFNKDMPFYLNPGIVNGSLGEITRRFRFVLFDREGNIKQLLSPEEEIKFSGESYLHFNWRCKIDVDINEGDRICVAAQGDDSKSWIPLPAERSDQIVFTKRSLSELVEIGYEKGFKFKETYLNNYFTRELTLYMRSYKDLCWKLSRKSDNKVLLNNSYITTGFENSDYSCHGNMVAPSGEENDDMVMYRFALLPGSYAIHFLNPATGETMDIDLEV